MTPNPDIEKLREELRRELYECLCWWGTLPEPEGDVPERYHRWSDLGEIADRILSLPAIRDRLRLQPIAPMPVFKSSESN